MRLDLTKNICQRPEKATILCGCTFSGANQVCALMVAAAGKAVGVTLVCRPLQACVLPPVIKTIGHDVWSDLRRWR